MTVKEFAKSNKITESMVYQLIKARRVDYTIIDNHVDVSGTYQKARKGRKAGSMSKVATDNK